MSKIKGVRVSRGKISALCRYEDLFFAESIAGAWWFKALCCYLYRWQYVRRFPSA